MPKQNKPIFVELAEVPSESTDRKKKPDFDDQFAFVKALKFFSTVPGNERLVEELNAFGARHRDLYQEKFAEKLGATATWAAHLRKAQSDDVARSLLCDIRNILKDIDALDNPKGNELDVLAFQFQGIVEEQQAENAWHREQNAATTTPSEDEQAGEQSAHEGAVEEEKPRLTNSPAAGGSDESTRAGAIPSDRSVIKLSEVARQIDKSKRTIESVMKSASDAPKPVIKGRSGQAFSYDFNEMRAFVAHQWRVEIIFPEKA